MVGLGGWEVILGGVWNVLGWGWLYWMVGEGSWAAGWLEDVPGLLLGSLVFWEARCTSVHQYNRSAPPLPEPLML